MGGKENPNAPLSIARSVREQLISIWESHHDDVDRIRADAELTDSGKDRRIRELADERQKKIAELRENLQLVEVAKKESVEKAKSQVAPEDRVVNTLLEIEVRKIVSEITDGDNMQVRLQYLDALDGNDHLIMDAIENAPKLWPGRLASNELTELKERRLLKTDPRLGYEIQAMAQALADTTTALDAVEGELRGPSDSLAAIASN